MSKVALITGIAGQDGSYLAELLLSKGYDVHGIVRRVAIEDHAHKLRNLKHIIGSVRLHAGSLDNVLSMIRTIRELCPDECYHLAASSFVSYSFEDEMSILNNNINNTHYLLAAIKEFTPACKFYFSGSSEMFGSAPICPQNEDTPFNPRSIYGISKVAGHYLTKNYRRQYGVFACSGILYNHESPRRGYEFVTRKIVSSAVKIKLGLQDAFPLGNIEACRDWGHASDYVRAMWLMLQKDQPDDYVIASGVLHSVKEFVETAFSYLGLDYKKYLRIDPDLFRPSENINLCGNPAKAKSELNWTTTRTFDELIREMVDHELIQYP